MLQNRCPPIKRKTFAIQTTKHNNSNNRSLYREPKKNKKWNSFKNFLTKQTSTEKKKRSKVNSNSMENVERNKNVNNNTI